MENASKALLIAGGVLITMIVASLGVYLYSVYHEHSEVMLAAMSEKEVTEFNSKFWAFEGKDLTANDVVSIVNLVREYNYSHEGDEYQISISWNTSGIFQQFDYRFDKVKYGQSLTDEEKNINPNKFINKYSEVTENTNGEKIYKYKFDMKVEGYNNLTSLVNNIKISATINS